MAGFFIRSDTLYQLYTSYLSIIFWWSWWEFNSKIDVTVQMRIFYNVNRLHAIFFQFEERLFISLAMLGLEAKARICSTIAKNLILYSPKFMTFVVTVINWHISITIVSQRKTSCKKIVKSAKESLGFQNELLNGAKYNILHRI